MPNPLTPERLAELRRLRSLSTAGPFAVHRYDCYDGNINYQLQNDLGTGDVLTNIFESVNANNRADADYLAALLNEAEAILDAAEERDRLRRQPDLAGQRCWEAQQEAERLRERVRELEAALRPFAAVYEPRIKDMHPMALTNAAEEYERAAALVGGEEAE